MMEVGSPGDSDAGEEKASLKEVDDENNEKTPVEDPSPVVVEEVVTTEEVKIEEKAPDEKKEEAQNKPHDEVVEDETKKEKAVEIVEEVREELELLSINEPKPEPQADESKPEPPPTPTAPKTKPNLSSIPNNQRIEQTKRFYNTHSQEFIDNISSRLALTPTSHRDAFITHVHLQQHLNTNDVITMIDLGCGFGRDVLHFTSLGHSVLGVDYSVKMLEHAKRLAPKAHYLNMDMRSLGGVLVEESVDGVWARSSLVHLPKCEVLDVLKGLYAVVKVGGMLYLSLRIGNADTLENNGEVFEADERYTINENAPLEDDSDVVYDDTRNKLYTYYTMEEVKELMANAGWDVLEMGKDDRREMSDYVQHTNLYVFATRRG